MLFNNKRNLIALESIFKILESTTEKLVGSTYDNRQFYEKELAYWKSEYEALIRDTLPKNKATKETTTK